MKVSTELVFGQLQTVNYPTYDTTKMQLGNQMRQYYSGTDPEESWVGPQKLAIARPFEQAATAGAMPYVITWSDNIQWVFLADQATPAATRRVTLYTYDTAQNQYSLKGTVIISFPTATVHTVRGMRVAYDKFTTGTVSSLGSSVTGVGTSWVTEGVSAGARIGFGTTDPTLVDTWYEILSVGTDTTLTLNAALPSNLPAGTPYVIEELTIIQATTNATLTNGGLFVTKGLHFGAFSPGGTAVPAATTIDHIRATYWLKDAATVTNTVAWGCALDDKINANSQNVYVINGLIGAVKIYAYNIRAPLTDLIAGATTLGYVLETGPQAVLGTVSQLNNGRLATTNHGPGLGVNSLYFVTSTRIYRAAVTNITAGNTSWISDVMLEMVPGGNNVTWTIISAFSSIEYSTVLDYMFVSTTVANQVITKYLTDGSPNDFMWGCDDRHLPQGLADNLASPIRPRLITTTPHSCYVEGGLMHFINHGNSAINSFMYAVPVTAHNMPDTNNVISSVVTPEIATPGASKYYRAYVNSAQSLGDFPFDVPTEPYSIYIRTSGISDNTGTWNRLPNNRMDLSGVAGAPSIQFKFEFKVLGVASSVPNRIYSLSIVYDKDDVLPAEFRWNLSDSSDANGTVGFTQSEVATSLLTITISYYRVDNNALLLTQDSTNTINGTFEFFNTTSSLWEAGVGPNVVNTRRRFVPSFGLPAGVSTYPKIVIG